MLLSLTGSFDSLMLEEMCHIMDFSNRYLKHGLGGYESI